MQLDMLRGAGALAVIVLHASANPLTEASSLGQPSWMLLVPNVTARFAVPVFVMLSGMALTLAARSDESYLRFLWRRLSRIVPAYLVWTLIYACVFPKHEALSVRTLLCDLLTGHASSHLYFVPAIVALYALYPLLRALAVPWGVVCCCALSLSMIWFSALLTSTALGELLDAALPLRFIGYFVLGIWFAQAGLASAALAHARRIAPAVAVTSLACMIATVRRVLAQSGNIDVALDEAEPLIFPYSVSVLLWSTSVSPGVGWIRRMLTFVSKHSYSVYLSHVLILHLCARTVHALVAERTHLMMFCTSLVFGIPLSLWAATLGVRAKPAE